MGTDLNSQLARWQAAGLIDERQARAIADYEAGRTPSPADRGQGAGISATEIVTYAGALITLAGLGTLLATQYRQLGTLGRLAIPALVAIAALLAVMLLPRERARARRAQASLVTLAVVAMTLFTGQLQVELLGGPTATIRQDTGYRIAITSGVVAAILAAAFLFWLRAGLIALTLALAVVLTAVYLRLLSAIEHGWAVEGLFLVAGIILVAIAEYGRQVKVVWATEVLAFAGGVVAMVAAFITAGNGNLPLELFGGLLALGAFAVSVVRSSAGYAFAGGVGLFAFVLDIEFRYFRSSLGFAVSLIIAGVALLGVSLLLARLLPRIRAAA